MVKTHSIGFCGRFALRLFIVVLCLFTLLSPSQTKLFAQNNATPAPEVSATVDKVEAFVGDVFIVTVSVIADSSARVAPLGLAEKLGDFDVQEVEVAEPVTLEDGRRRYRTTIKLWALEIGESEIPSLPVYYTGQDDVVDSAQTSAMTVTVSSVVGDALDSASIKPLREPLPDPLGLNQGFVRSKLFGWLLIGLIVVIGVLVWWFILRKRKEETEWVDPRPTWQIALDRLADLRNQPFLAQELYKEYYTELTDTLRDYLGSALSTHTQDMTSSELLSSLEADSLTIVYRGHIADVLKQADMVKFAKAKPRTERPTQDFETVYSVIQSLRDDLAERMRIEEERQAAMQAQKNLSASNEAEIDGRSNSEEIAPSPEPQHPKEVSQEDRNV